MPLALVLIVLAAAWRVLAVFAPALSNFAPLMALTFCGAVYFRDRRMWFVPLLALTFSDFFLNAYYAAATHTTWSWSSELVRLACFAAAIPVGRWVASRKNWVTLFAGALGGSILFYLATNTDAWFMDPVYAKTAAGWWQAMTIGHPEYLPTLFFFRNTLVSDLLFTAAFAVAMEVSALRAHRPSLLKPHATA
ncbi:MAG TPA: DUF6580 family putative transport protein [Opitutaceae bacterium]|nr:DUF6580 family putative transport protein [Opitutaceae bacterium]